MFSRIFRGNTNIPTQNFVEPQVQRSEITDPTEIQSSGGQTGDHNPTDKIPSSGSKRKESIQSEDGTVSKYCRFELKPENIENEWNLPTQLASYVKKYMSTHISEKDIREKILATNPIPHNVKGTQKLDEFFKELLSDSKKLSTLNQEKTLKGTQKKVASILAPLTRLWNIMEAELEALLDNDDEATSGHMEIATLFERRIILIGQAFNEIAYHRLLNILNTLIDNVIKIK